MKIPTAGTWPGEKLDGMLSSRTAISDRVKARIAAGECLIAEPDHDVSEANAVVWDLRLNKGAFLFSTPWKSDVDTLTARRLTVSLRAERSKTSDVFQQTSVEAHPIIIPLFIGPYSHCSSGACSVKLGIARRSVKQGEYDLRTFFMSKSGLNVAAVDAVAAASVTTLLRDALTDPSLKSDSPNLKLVDQYLKALSEKGPQGDDDVGLLKLIILDRRIKHDPRKSDLFYLSAAIHKLGETSAPLAEPLIQRIFTSDLPEPYTSALLTLPPSAALPIMPQLHSLAKDEQRRLKAAPALVRLADEGSASAPIFLELIKIGEAAKSDKLRYSNLTIAGLRGLCLLGPDGASAAPELLGFVRDKARQRSSLGPLQSLAVAALVRMGKRDEVEKLFDAQEPLHPYVIRRANETERWSSPERACYY